MMERPMIELTEDIIKSGMSKRGSWSKAQLRAIGVAWPPVKGWKKDVVGQMFSMERIASFLSGQNLHQYNS